MARSVRQDILRVVNEYEKGDEIFLVHRKKDGEAHEIVYGSDDEYALIGLIELGKKTLMAPYNNYETNGLE